jgi:aldose 1-epimerase
MRTTTSSLVNLSDGIATATVATLGGSLASFCWRGDGRRFDWLRPAGPRALSQGDAGEMSCFPLIPYSNRVRGGRFMFRGRIVELPVSATDPHFEHGHGWRSHWHIEEERPSWLRLSYCHAPDAWPWRYEAVEEIGLADGALCIRLILRNLSDEPMPAGFGLHPYFPALPGTKFTTNVAAMWETDSEVLPTRLVEAAGRLDALDVRDHEFDNVFTGWSRSARIVWPSASLHLEADPPLNFLVLYTPAGEPFFAAEPVSNITDALNLASAGHNGTGLFELEPGQSRAADVRFTPCL